MKIVNPLLDNIQKKLLIYGSRGNHITSPRFPEISALGTLTCGHE